jgi:hypothetical protein
MNEGFPQPHPDELPPEPQQQVEQLAVDALDGHLSIAAPQRIEVSEATPTQEVEHVHIIDRGNDVPENNEQPTNAAEQEAPVETGLISMEREKTLEKADIDDLQQRAGELRGINDVQQGLETSIISAGLQVMADRYGADKLLAALQTRSVTTFRGVIEQLASDKTERQALYDAIKAEPMDALAERFDQTLGGVADGNPRVSAMERKRKFDMFTIQGPVGLKERVADRIPSKFHQPDRGGGINDTHGLFSGDFDDLLKNNPDLVQQFRETNDTLGLLKGVREIYEAKYTDFATNLEAAKTTVEAKVAEGEAGVAELQAISDDIYYDEIARLEERLAGTSSDAAREMVQDMLDKKTAEFMATHEEFKNRIEAVRTEIVADLGAQRLNQLPVATPVTRENVAPIYNDKEKHAA